MPPSVERKLAAILSADVVGYSRLMAEDEAGTIRTLGAYRTEITHLVEHHRGRVADFTGDNFLADFPTALDAVECAVEIQGVLRVRNLSLAENRRMEFRIGLHLGDVAVEGERLYGDGVNIAARLEGLAEPGGICISANVLDQVRHKLSQAYEDLGEQSLKNVADPVRVYRVRPTAGEAADDAASSGIPGFEGRPAIAVLAFDNLSGDREQEYFADGIAEDLITRLSACRHFPVIARNSSFVYKGHPVDVKRVSEELGVRYVVEGSVRRAGNRVRISAQLIDATTGAHIWAERYDRELSDVFALQDEITEAIAGSMQPGLAEQERARRARPRSLDAWELAQRGWWHFWKFTKEDFVSAHQFFTSALELDPEFAWACSGLALTYFYDLTVGWTDSPSDSRQRAIELAQRSAALDPADFFSQFALVCIYVITGHRSEAIAAAERTLELNPSLAMAHVLVGRLRLLWDHPEQAIEHFEKAMRLNPRDPLFYTFVLNIGMAHFAAGRYAEAAEWVGRSLREKAPGPGGSSDFPTSAIRMVLVAALAQLGRIDEARATLETIPQNDLQLGAMTRLMSALDVGFSERFIDGLRKAGWTQ